MKEKIKSLVDKITSLSTNKDETTSLLLNLIQKVEEDSKYDKVLNCGNAEETFSDDTYEVVKTDRGILFHHYGGYSIFVTPNNTSLYSSLEFLLDANKKTYENEEEKELYSSVISAITHCLGVPLLAFSNVEYMYEVAIKNIEFINKTYDELMNQPLQAETLEEDENFKNATLALNEILKGEKK